MQIAIHARARDAHERERERAEAAKCHHVVPHTKRARDCAARAAQARRLLMRGRLRGGARHTAPVRLHLHAVERARGGGRGDIEPKVRLERRGPRGARGAHGVAQPDAHGLRARERGAVEAREDALEHGQRHGADARAHVAASDSDRRRLRRRPPRGHEAGLHLRPAAAEAEDGRRLCVRGGGHGHGHGHGNIGRRSTGPRDGHDSTPSSGHGSIGRRRRRRRLRQRWRLRVGTHQKIPTALPAGASRVDC